MNKIVWTLIVCGILFVISGIILGIVASGYEDPRRTVATAMPVSLAHVGFISTGFGIAIAHDYHMEL